MAQSTRDAADQAIRGTVSKGLAAVTLPRDIDETLLFGRADLSAVLRAHLEGVDAAVKAVSPLQFATLQHDEIRAMLEDRLLVMPLELNEPSLRTEQREIEVDVSRDPRRNALKDKGPIYMIGVSLVVRIPYTGDDLLWQLRPGQWRDHFPRGIVHPFAPGRRGELEISSQRPADEDISILREGLRREMESIRFYLRAQAPQIAAANGELRAAIQRALEARHRLPPAQR